MVKASVVEHIVNTTLKQLKQNQQNMAINTLETFLSSIPSSSRRQRINKHIRKKPRTAYNYFISKQMMSEEIQKIPSRERFGTVSARWNKLTQEEKKYYENCLHTDENIEQKTNLPSQEPSKENVVPIGDFVDKNVDKNVDEDDIDLDLQNAFDEIFGDGF